MSTLEASDSNKIGKLEDKLNSLYKDLATIGGERSELREKYDLMKQQNGVLGARIASLTSAYEELKQKYGMLNEKSESYLALLKWEDERRMEASGYIGESVRSAQQLSDSIGLSVEVATAAPTARDTGDVKVSSTATEFPRHCDEATNNQPNSTVHPLHISQTETRQSPPPKYSRKPAPNLPDQGSMASQRKGQFPRPKEPPLLGQPRISSPYAFDGPSLSIVQKYHVQEYGEAIVAPPTISLPGSIGAAGGHSGWSSSAGGGKNSLEGKERPNAHMKASVEDGEEEL